jgi:hypothetical protein
VHPDIDLAGFLDESGLELDDVYDGSKSWSDLQAAAGAPVRPDGPHETELRRAVGRLLHIDDDERIATYQRLLAATTAPSVDAMPERERRLVRMLVAALTGRAITKDTSLQESLDLLWTHPQVRAELQQLLAVLDAHVDHLHAPLATHPDVPLLVHGRYSRIEILAAFGIGTGAKIAAWQSGVYEAKDANAELFAFTLDKSSGSFSPTTRYRDYAISRTLIHWESQSITRADSPPRPPLPPPRARRPLDHALHPPASRRPSLLVPRPRPLRPPRRRKAHSHHLGARPPPTGRPLRIVRRCRGLRRARVKR